MNELIVLRGASDSGKSSTIKHLAHLFLQAESLFSFVGDSNEKNLLLSRVAGKKWYVNGNIEGSVTDIKKVIFKCGDIKIGITSIGDDWSGIEEQIRWFIGKDCSICICAAHPTVKMDKKLEDFRMEIGCKSVISVYKNSLRGKTTDEQCLSDRLIACELFSKVTEAVRRSI